MTRDSKHHTESSFKDTSIKEVKGSVDLQQAGRDIVQNISLIINSNNKFCEEKLGFIQQQVELLKSLLIRIESFAEARKWLGREIEGNLSQEICVKVLSEEVFSEKQAEDFCRTLENYLIWIELSLKTGELIDYGIDEVKLKPVFPLKRYLIAIKYIKEKASLNLSNEAKEEVSKLLDDLFESLRNFKT